MNILPNNTNTNFKANVKYTPYIKKLYGKMTADHMERFLNTQRNLKAIDNKSELLITRKKTYDRKIIPVIINLNTGAMVANFNSDIRKLTKSTVDLLEKITDTKNSISKIIFSKKPNIIKDSIDNVLVKTTEISIHPPIPQQKLSHIDLLDDEILKMKKYDSKFSNKVNIFAISKDLKLHIKNYDEGYIFNITDMKNKPTGNYFSVTYTSKGFRINYDNSKIDKNSALKIFNRYTQKSLEQR